MADVTISGLTQAFPTSNSIVPFSENNVTYGSALCSLYIDSNPFKTNTTLNKPRFLVSQDTVNNTSGTGPGNSLPLASFYANTIVGTAAVPRGLEIGAPAGNVTAPVYLKVSSTSNRFAIFDENNTENFTIKNGNVGIGTAAPAERLTVSGNMSASGDVKATNTAKAYAIFDGSNAINTECTVLKGYNISKIEKLGNVGEYKVTFASSVSWPYVPVTGGFNNGTGNGGWNSIAYLQTTYGYPEPSNTGFNIHGFTSSGGWQSQKYVSFAVF